MNKNITRSDLAEAVCQELGLSFLASERLVDTFFEEIIKAFERGENVKLSSFATFSLYHKKERLGRNPKTGKEYPITARSILAFTPSQMLKKAVMKAKK